MKAQGATTEEIVQGYPSLTTRMVELAEIWTAAHPARGRRASFRPWRNREICKASLTSEGHHQNSRQLIS